MNAGNEVVDTYTMDDLTIEEEEAEELEYDFVSDDDEDETLLTGMKKRKTPITSWLTDEDEKELTDALIQVIKRQKTESVDEKAVVVRQPSTALVLTPSQSNLLVLLKHPTSLFASEEFNLDAVLRLLGQNESERITGIQRLFVKDAQQLFTIPRMMNRLLQKVSTQVTWDEPLLLIAISIVFTIEQSIRTAQGIVDRNALRRDASDILLVLENRIAAILTDLRIPKTETVRSMLDATRKEAARIAQVFRSPEVPVAAALPPLIVRLTRTEQTFRAPDKDIKAQLLEAVSRPKEEIKDAVLALLLPDLRDALTNQTTVVDILRSISELPNWTEQTILIAVTVAFVIEATPNAILYLRTIREIVSALRYKNDPMFRDVTITALSSALVYRIGTMLPVPSIEVTMQPAAVSGDVAMQPVDVKTQPVAPKDVKMKAARLPSITPDELIRNAWNRTNKAVRDKYLAFTNGQVFEQLQQRIYTFEATPNTAAAQQYANIGWVWLACYSRIVTGESMDDRWQVLAGDLSPDILTLCKLSEWMHQCLLRLNLNIMDPLRRTLRLAEIACQLLLHVVYEYHLTHRDQKPAVSASAAQAVAVKPEPTQPPPLEQAVASAAATISTGDPCAPEKEIIRKLRMFVGYMRDTFTQMRESDSKELKDYAALDSWIKTGIQNLADVPMAEQTKNEIKSAMTTYQIFVNAATQWWTKHNTESNLVLAYIERVALSDDNAVPVPAAYPLITVEDADQRRVGAIAAWTIATTARTRYLQQQQSAADVTDWKSAYTYLHNRLERRLLYAQAVQRSGENAIVGYNGVLSQIKAFANVVHESYLIVHRVETPTADDWARLRGIIFSPVTDQKAQHWIGAVDPNLELKRALNDVKIPVELEAPDVASETEIRQLEDKSELTVEKLESKYVARTARVESKFDDIRRECEENKQSSKLLATQVASLHAGLAELAIRCRAREQVPAAAAPIQATHVVFPTIQPSETGEQFFYRLLRDTDTKYQPGTEAQFIYNQMKQDIKSAVNEVDLVVKARTREKSECDRELKSMQRAKTTAEDERNSALRLVAEFKAAVGSGLLSQCRFGDEQKLLAEQLAKSERALFEHVDLEEAERKADQGDIVMLEFALQRRWLIEFEQKVSARLSAAVASASSDRTSVERLMRDYSRFLLGLSQEPAERTALIASATSTRLDAMFLDVERRQIELERKAATKLLDEVERDQRIVEALLTVFAIDVYRVQYDYVGRHLIDIAEWLVSKLRSIPPDQWNPLQIIADMQAQLDIYWSDPTSARGQLKIEFFGEAEQFNDPRAVADTLGDIADRTFRDRTFPRSALEAIVREARDSAQREATARTQRRQLLDKVKTDTAEKKVATDVIVSVARALQNRGGDEKKQPVFQGTVNDAIERVRSAVLRNEFGGGGGGGEPPGGGSALSISRLRTERRNPFNILYLFFKDVAGKCGSAEMAPFMARSVLLPEDRGGRNRETGIVLQTVARATQGSEAVLENIRSDLSRSHQEEDQKTMEEINEIKKQLASADPNEQSEAFELAYDSYLVPTAYAALYSAMGMLKRQFGDGTLPVLAAINSRSLRNALAQTVASNWIDSSFMSVDHAVPEVEEKLELNKELRISASLYIQQWIVRSSNYGSAWSTDWFRDRMTRS